METTLMKNFSKNKKAIVVVLFSFCLFYATKAHAGCDCSPEVTSAYNKQIRIVKGYYDKLKKQINNYEKQMDIYNKKYASSLLRRKALLALLKQRKIEIINERFILNNIVEYPISFNDAKNEQIENDLKLFEKVKK